jgi:hypothetical protein
MIWSIRNSCLLETLTGMNMIQVESNIKTHKVYLKTLDL